MPYSILLEIKSFHSRFFSSASAIPYLLRLINLSPLIQPSLVLHVAHCSYPVYLLFLPFIQLSLSLVLHVSHCSCTVYLLFLPLIQLSLSLVLHLR